MSEAVLGKRNRGDAGASEHDHGRVSPPANVEEDSDDDVGPKPFADNSPSNEITKKKRKGMFNISLSGCRTSWRQNWIPSSTSRTIVLGPSPKCRSILQELHAPRYHQLLCGHKANHSSQFCESSL